MRWINEIKAKYEQENEKELEEEHNFQKWGFNKVLLYLKFKILKDKDFNNKKLKN